MSQQRTIVGETNETEFQKLMSKEVKKAKDLLDNKLVGMACFVMLESGEIRAVTHSDYNGAMGIIQVTAAYQKATLRGLKQLEKDGLV